MANTIENTTDEALLRSIIDGSIEGCFEDDTITNVSAYKFAYCSNLEKVNLPNVTTLNEYTFSNCGSLTDAILPKTELSGHSYQFNNCTSLVNVDVSGATNFNSGNRFFNGCTALKKLFFPSLTSVDNASRNLGCSNLEIAIFPELLVAQGSQWIPSGNLKEIDFGKVTNFTNHFIDGGGGYSVGTGIRAIIIRTPSVPTLANTGYALQNWLAKDSTPAGDSKYNYNYNIYVPQSLISDYQNATNWSEYSSRFTAIEGTKYDGFCADGTPIGFSNNYGLIGFYNVSDSSRYEAIEGVRSHINSTTDSELIAYTALSRSSVNRPSDSNAIVPTIFYDNKYCNSPGALNIFSTTPFFDDNDVITIEFSMAINPSSTVELNYIRLQTCFSNKQNITDSLGANNITVDTRNFNGFNQRQFLHRTIIVYKNGTIKGYINGVYKMSQSLNQSAIQATKFIGVGSNGQDNAYLGPVAIWNRALTEDEIAEHYQYYVDNYHVGETAFDSSGNFIAGQS